MDDPNNQGQVQDQGVATATSDNQGPIQNPGAVADVPADASVQPVAQPISQPAAQPIMQPIPQPVAADEQVVEIPETAVENSQPVAPSQEAPQAAVGEQQPVEEVPAATGENQ